MSRYTAASDWNRLSGEFAAWLPLIAPYGERLIERARPEPGMGVLDLACGTGEPGLTLAERMPGVRVTGADGAPGMARAARAAGRERGIDAVRFAVARGEMLPFADGAFDVVICRFGLMLFDDPVAGLAEIRRVTRPGGRVALAVWSVPDRVLCPALTLAVLERFAREPVEWPRTFSLSAPGRLAALCDAAKLAGVREETYDPGFTFRDIDHFMERNLTGRFIEKPYGAMTGAEQARFRAALAEAARGYALADGRIRLPQEAIVVSAWRP